MDANKGEIWMVINLKLSGSWYNLTFQTSSCSCCNNLCCEGDNAVVPAAGASAGRGEVRARHRRLVLRLHPWRTVHQEAAFPGKQGVTKPPLQENQGSRSRLSK